jgi:hypothetical protein
VNVYMFQAALLCAECGLAQRGTLTVHGKRPTDLADESSYDSDQFPKGPYPDGGGEADSPQHCDHCGTFLNNPLTPDGVEAVSNMFTEYMRTGRGNESALREWKEAYPEAWDAVADFMEEQAAVSDLRRIRFEILTD